MAVKSAALLLLLPLLQEVGADWTTTVHTTLIVPNTVTPVVKFVTPPATPLSSTPSSLPLTYDHANSHKLKLTSIVTVPDGQIPTVHFSTITSSGKPTGTDGGSGGTAPPRVTTSPGSANSGASSATPNVGGSSAAEGTPGNPPTSSAGVHPGGHSSSKPLVSNGSTTSGSHPKHTTKSGSPAGTSGDSSKSGSPDGPTSSQPNNTGTKGSDTSSSKPVGPSESTPNSPGSTAKSTLKGPASDPTTTKSTSPSDGASTGQAPSGTPDHSTTSHPSSLPTVNPSDQVSSVDLASATDLQSAAAINSDIADFLPSASPFQEEWASMPATTTSGSPASTSSGSAIIALMLRNSYNNIDDLKKDPKSYKKHIEDIDDQTSKYLSKTGFDTGKSPCSGSKKRSSIEKRGLLDAVTSIAKSAVSATVDTASDIANSALSCVAPIVDDIKNVIPDDVDVKDITPEIEDQVKKGTEYLDEISNIVDDMDEKKKDDDDHTSSSKSDSSTTSSSTTGTCTSSTTYSDCTWDTIVTPVANSDTTTISVITSTKSCTTRTGCDEKPSTFETTSTVDACSFVSVQEAPGVGVAATSFIVSTTSGVSGGSSATAHSTASPGSAPKTTGSSSTTKSSVTTTSAASASPDRTSTGNSSETSTAATTTSSPMCELEVIGSSYSVCTCSSTMGSHTLSHAMLKPSSTDCGDIKTFPMTSFIQVPTPTQTSYICVNTPNDLNGNQGAFCQCSSTMTKTDATTTDTSQTVAVVSLPYIMGSQTVLDQCADITDFPSDGISATSDSQTQPTRTFTDFTSTDFANNNVVYVYTAGAEYYDYSKYGVPDITGPVTWTTGIGDPVKEFVHDYTSTNDGGTVYAYAEATGDGNGNVAPAGTPTATSVPEPTHNCVKFVVPAPGDEYNSATEQYLFTWWGIDHWSKAKDIERDIEDVLKDNGVKSDISIEADTGRWGTVTMWNNGRESDITPEVRDGLEGLESGKPDCKWIYKTGFDVNFPVKDSAVDELEWIYKNHPEAIKSPYPLKD